MDDAPANPLVRGWRAWTRFWFSPADPTPLCLMRIVAGILALYVHFAYTFDLAGMFGPSGWYDHRETSDTRLELPHLDPLKLSPEGFGSFRQPKDVKQRKLLRDFLFQILAERDARILANLDPDRELKFMYSLSLDGAEREELLRYLRTVPLDRAERDARFKPYLDDSVPVAERDLWPRYFWRQTTPESKRYFVAELMRFNDILPKSPDDRRILLQLFLDKGLADWQAIQGFVRELGEIPPAERLKELDYQAKWGLPRRLNRAEGLPNFSPWFHAKEPWAIWTIHGLNLLALAAFTVGYCTRVTSVMAWLVGLSYIHRAQAYLFGQDTMMNLCLLYLILSPCGAKWSLDRWLAKRRAAARGEPVPPVLPSVSAGFALRVFQVQYCLMYMSAGCAKLKGNAWWNGTAMFACMSNAEFAPMHVGLYRRFMQWFCAHKAIFEIVNTSASALTLLTELSFPFLSWTKMRPVVVAMALLMHTGIAVLMGLSVFSLFMFALLLCWMPTDAINWMFDSDESASGAA